MYSSQGVLKHQFDDLTQQREASTIGMWVFLTTEVMFFGGLFLGYAIYRNMYPQAYIEGSHHLNIFLGSINTVILIASSLTMVLAVHGAHTNNKKNLILFLILTIILGSAFLGIKVVEYSHKFHEHLIPGLHFGYHGPEGGHMQIFFSFYFAMTGMHALHMIIGIAVLSVLVVMSFQNKFSAAYDSPVEFTGLYWHFVDIVWIFLFPLLYLIGRHGQ